jgi:hypothetical protein
VYQKSLLSNELNVLEISGVKVSPELKLSNSRSVKKTINLTEKHSSLKTVNNVVYVYLLDNNNLSIGFTTRSFFIRTFEHVKQDKYRITKVVGIYRLKSTAPIGINCCFLESLIHSSIAKFLQVDIKMISNSTNNGFECDAFSFLNIILSINDFKYYQAKNPIELKEINRMLKLRGLLVP